MDKKTKDKIKKGMSIIIILIGIACVIASGVMIYKDNKFCKEKGYDWLSIPEALCCKSEGITSNKSNCKYIRDIKQEEDSGLIDSYRKYKTKESDVIEVSHNIIVEMQEYLAKMAKENVKQ